MFIATAVTVYVFVAPASSDIHFLLWSALDFHPETGCCTLPVSYFWLFFTNVSQLYSSTLLKLPRGLAGSGSTLKTCGGELSGMYGDFQSPGFPDKYPKDVNCVWNITVAVGHHVRVEFTEFQLEEHSYECEYDRVTVLEGTVSPIQAMPVCCICLISVL